MSSAVKHLADGVVQLTDEQLEELAVVGGALHTQQRLSRVGIARGVRPEARALQHWLRGLKPPSHLPTQALRLALSVYT